MSYFQRVHFDIQVGDQAIDYAQVAQKEKLTELQLRIRQLLDQVDQITKEQNYQRVRSDFEELGCLVGFNYFFFLRLLMSYFFSVSRRTFPCYQ